MKPTEVEPEPTGFSDLPPELLILIFSFLNIDDSPIPLTPSTRTRQLDSAFDDGPSLDVYIPTLDPAPHPTQAELTRSSFAALSLVCRRFNAAVRPYLWDDVILQNGRGWMRVVDALVEEVVVPTTEEEQGHVHGHGQGHGQEQSLPSVPENAAIEAFPQHGNVFESDNAHEHDHEHAYENEMHHNPEYVAELLSPQMSASSTHLLPVLSSSPPSLSEPLTLPSPSPSKPQLYREPTPFLPVNELTFSVAPPLDPHDIDEDEDDLYLGMMPPPVPSSDVCMDDEWCRARGRGCCSPRREGEAVAGEEERGRGGYDQFGSSGLNLHIPTSRGLVGEEQQEQRASGEGLSTAAVVSETTGLETSSGSGSGSGSGFRSGLGMGMPSGLASGPRSDPSPPASASSTPSIISNFAQHHPYLPSILTPPGSRRSSPHRLRSRSLSRSRSRSQKAARNELSPERSAGGPPSVVRRQSTLRRAATSEDVHDEKEEMSEAAEMIAEAGTGGILQRLDSTEGTTTTTRSENMHIQSRPEPESKEILDYFGEDWRYGILDMDEEMFEEDPDTPGPLIKHLSFANFRTTGTRRTQEEAVRGKFVTGGRLEGVLKNAPKLRSLAMTEYVDSSLTLPVLTELFFRGYERPAHPYSAEQEALDGQNIYTHATEYVPYEPETDEEQWERRAEFSQMEALDFTGCVSKVFGESLLRFVQGWLVPSEGEFDPEEDRGRSRRDDRTWESSSLPWIKPTFPGLKRLSLRGCVTLSSELITTLISCCPNISHLDLSFTRVSPATLQVLASQPDLKLTALSLARSTRLTSESVREFLMHAPCAATIIDFNLYGDQTYESPLNPEDLEIIIRYAPCFQSGQLRYLDLSGAPFSRELLDPTVFSPQPRLKSLGLSFIPSLPLQPLANFLLHNASNIEVLTLTHSSTLLDLGLTLSSLAVNMNFHSKLVNPLCLPPFSVYGPSPDGPGAPTRLRIIELSQTVRKALGTGARDWKTIRSKGGRGWYVDTSAGWVGEHDHEHHGPSRIVFKRLLDRDHPWRRYLEHLSQADGKVSSGVGWHSRKMEIVKGHGMMGREEGLYGAGAFAFEG